MIQMEKHVFSLYEERPISSQSAGQTRCADACQLDIIARLLY